MSPCDSTSCKSGFHSAMTSATTATVWLFCTQPASCPACFASHVSHGSGPPSALRSPGPTHSGSLPNSHNVSLAFTTVLEWPGASASSCFMKCHRSLHVFLPCSENIVLVLVNQQHSGHRCTPMVSGHKRTTQGTVGFLLPSEPTSAQALPTTCPGVTGPQFVPQKARIPDGP